MNKMDNFIAKYKDLIWAIFMFTFCIVNILVIVIDFNVWSLVGLICCGISAVLNLSSFIMDMRYDKHKGELE